MPYEVLHNIKYRQELFLFLEYISIRWLNTKGITYNSIYMFSDKGIKVVGISSDSNTSHQKFAQKHQLPFTLLSDPDGKVRKLFHVKSTLLGILPGRETFLFDKEGKLTFKFRSISGDSHVKEALKYIS